MQIRRTIPDDAEAIADIWNYYIRETIVTFNSQEKHPDDLARAIGNLETPFFVAEGDTGLNGFATYSDFRKGIGYARTREHTINLAPGTSGRGLGRALMRAIEDHAREQGIHSLFAGVSGENTAGVAFHAACGYHTVARLSQVGWKFNRWHDLVLMQKFL